MSIAPLRINSETADTCARAITAATMQIELALHEAAEPVEQLGTLMARLAKVLGEIRNERDRDAALDQRLERLRADLSTGIEKLQFYDRMVQHLSHIRDYLSAISNHITDGTAMDEETVSEEAWEELRAHLRKRLISDPQRWLLDLVLPPTEWQRDAPAAETEDLPAAQGSIELF
jgi:hypothetical protein